MTVRAARYQVVCPCGHSGFIHCITSLLPTDSSWEHYLLERLDGASGYSQEGFASWGEVFNALEPSCPRCRNSLTARELNTSSRESAND